MTPWLHEIAGEGWRISFQRRIGSGPSANRGALPVLLTPGADLSRALVPLPDGEAVWLAIMCSKRTQITARTSAGEHLPTTSLAGSEDDALMALESIERNGDRISIDANSIDRLEADQPPVAHLSISMAPEGAEPSTVEVAFTTPEYYETMTGLHVRETSIHDAFDGRLLP